MTNRSIKNSSNASNHTINYIYIRTPNGKGNRISMNDNTTLMDISQPIQKLLNINDGDKLEYSLFYRGSEVNDFSATLTNLKITHESIIHIQPKLKQHLENVNIKIKFNENHHTFQLTTNSNVAYLKDQISRVIGLAVDEIILCHQGQKLENNQSLYSYGIEGQVWLSIHTKNKKLLQDANLVESCYYDPIEQPMKLSVSKGNNPWLKKFKNVELNDVMFKSVVSMEESQGDDMAIPYNPNMFDKEKLQFSINISNMEQTKYYTINCKHNLVVSQLKAKLAQLENVNHDRIKLLNEQNKELLIYEGFEVKDLPGQYKIIMNNVIMNLTFDIN